MSPKSYPNNYEFGNVSSQAAQKGYRATKPLDHVITYLSPDSPQVSTWKPLLETVEIFKHRPRPKAEHQQAVSYLDKLFKTLSSDQRATQQQILAARPSNIMPAGALMPEIFRMRDADLRQQHQYFQPTIVGAQLRTFLGLIKGNVEDYIDLKAVTALYSDTSSVDLHKSTQRHPGPRGDFLYARDDCLLMPQDLYAARDMALCAAVTSGGLKFGLFSRSAKFSKDLIQAHKDGADLIERSLNEALFEHAYKRPPATVRRQGMRP